MLRPGPRRLRRYGGETGAWCSSMVQACCGNAQRSFTSASRRRTTATRRAAVLAPALAWPSACCSSSARCGWSLNRQRECYRTDEHFACHHSSWPPPWGYGRPEIHDTVLIPLRTCLKHIDWQQRTPADESAGYEGDLQHLNPKSAGSGVLWALSSGRAGSSATVLAASPPWGSSPPSALSCL